MENLLPVSENGMRVPSARQVIKGRIVLVSFLFVVGSSSCKSCECIQKNLLITDAYKAYEAPLQAESKPTYVFVNLDIMDIDYISEENMEYSMQFYVNEYWKDMRLNNSYFGKGKRIQVPRSWVPDLWTPDTIFENSQGGWIYPLSIPNTCVQFHDFSYIHRFTRYSMKVKCSMTFYSYPMDTQNCYLSITSLANDNSKVEFKWLHEREEGNSGIPDLALAKFAPLKYYVNNVSTGKRLNLWPSGDFTVLYVNFTFMRHISSHIFNVFIPSGMVVILSFLTFWLNVKSVPARVALGLTSLLTLSTQASQARNHLPPINYLTALDVWLFSCIMLVFLSLIEYATVYHLHNEKIQKKKRPTEQEDQWADKRSTRSSVSGIRNVPHSEKERTSMKKSISSPKNAPPEADLEEDTQLLDKSCRILFPLTFVIFSIVYWVVYLGLIR